MQANHVRGQRAGLVGAQDVDVGERLDGVGLLDERPLTGHARGAEGVGQHDGEDQAVGHQGDDHRRHLHALDERQVLRERLERDQHLEGDDDDDEDPHEHVGLVLQGCEEAPVRLGLGGDLVGEAVGADLFGFVVAAAGHAEAARQERVSGTFDHGVGLAGQQRFVDLQRTRPEQPAVDHDLIAGRDLQRVADDEFGRVDLALPAVAHDHRVRPGQDGDAIEGALGAHLLVEADHSVDQHDADREQRVEVVAHGDEHDGEREEEVVDEVEDVVANDLAVGAAAGRHLVAVARRPPPRRFSLGQADPGGGAFDTVSRFGGNGELLGGAQAIVPSVRRALAACTPFALP